MPGCRHRVCRNQWKNSRIVNAESRSWKHRSTSTNRSYSILYPWLHLHAMAIWNWPLNLRGRERTCSSKVRSRIWRKWLVIKNLTNSNSMQKFAEFMGWIVPKDNGYKPGPNLRAEMFHGTKPTPVNLCTGRTNPYFLKVKADNIRLGCVVNFRFIKLNHAFRELTRISSRSFLIYCSVGGTNMVGNKVPNLLRKIRFQRKGKGINYTEPLHVHYLPVRSDKFETQLSDSIGRLVKLSEGDTILPLHLKRIWSGAVWCDSDPITDKRRWLVNVLKAMMRGAASGAMQGLKRSYNPLKTPKMLRRERRMVSNEAWNVPSQ